MKTKDIKTVDVQAKEWFDKVNGNSYFSAVVTVNFGMKNETSFYMPMQYGYGEHYRDQAFKAIRKKLNCFKASKGLSYWREYEENNIIARHSKQENCKKREL